MITYKSYQDYRNTQGLVEQIANEKITQVAPPSFHSVLRNYDKINAIEGDVVECGTWKGGFGIFLSKVFPQRNIWICDSFDGFQDPANSNYPEYTTEWFTPHNKGQDFVKVCQSDVMDNFRRYGLTVDIYDERVRFLKGFVKDTLPTIPIEKIALLRVDVDAYAATREVLDYLYPKVVKGGMIIFDDSHIYQSIDAIKDYYESIKAPLKMYHPDNDTIVVNTETNQPEWAPDYTTKSEPRYNYQYPSSCYTFKE